jgi:hypothetical protein
MFFLIFESPGLGWLRHLQSRPAKRRADRRRRSATGEGYNSGLVVLTCQLDPLNTP